jgi:hypothetical protein
LAVGLSATSQHYFSLGTNQPLAISQQYFSLGTNHHQPPAKGTYCVVCCAQLRPPSSTCAVGTQRPRTPNTIPIILCSYLPNIHICNDRRFFFCLFERNDRRVLLYSHPMCELFFASRVQTSTHPAIITSHNHEAPASLCISYAPNVLMAIGEQVVPAIQLAKADQRSAPLKTEN